MASTGIRQPGSRNSISELSISRECEMSLQMVCPEPYSLRKIVRKMTQLEWLKSTSEETELNEFKKMKKISLSHSSRSLLTEREQKS